MLVLIVSLLLAYNKMNSEAEKEESKRNIEEGPTYVLMTKIISEKQWSLLKAKREKYL